MQVVRFTVLGQAKGKERPRVVRLADGKPHTYTPTRTKNAEESIARAYKRAAKGVTFGDKVIKVGIRAFFQIPTSWTKAEKARARQGLRQPYVKPDLDNIAKMFLDALNGVAYNDDKQIISMDVSKTYGEPARTEVVIQEWEVSSWNGCTDQTRA